MILRIDSKNNKEIVDKVSSMIKSGGIAILPFDTVYGIVCDPYNKKALERIYEFKKRPSQKTVGLALSNIEKLNYIAEITNNSKKYIEDRTPGRYTFILKKKNNTKISEFCTQKDTIGIRVPDSKLILSIAEATGGIIAQTSANLSGQPNCFSIDNIRDQYDDKSLSTIDLIIDGGTLENTGASKLVDLTGDRPIEIERK